MRRSPAKFSESEASNHTPSLADFTTTTPELKFSVHTGCTKSSNEGSRRRPCCRRPIPLRCCSGRCLPPVRSTCARWMAGRRSPQNPSISRLTSQPETIPSCYRRSRHTEFQPHPGRHLTMIDQLTEHDRIELLAHAQDAWDRAPQNTMRAVFEWRGKNYVVSHSSSHLRIHTEEGIKVY